MVKENCFIGQYFELSVIRSSRQILCLLFYCQVNHYNLHLTAMQRLDQISRKISEGTFCHLDPMLVIRTKTKTNTPYPSWIGELVIYEHKFKKFMFLVLLSYFFYVWSLDSIVPCTINWVVTQPILDLGCCT